MKKWMEYVVWIILVIIGLLIIAGAIKTFFF